MATKNSKLAGSQLFYIEQAVKLCPYHCDIKEGLIYVSADAESEAVEDLTVQHLLAIGFLIQLGIPGGSSVKKVFNPSIRLTEKVVERAKNEFLVGDAFRIKSSECELEIVRFDKGKVQLRYLNRPKKHDLLISEEQLKKSLSWELWERI